VVYFDKNGRKVWKTPRKMPPGGRPSNRELVKRRVVDVVEAVLAGEILFCKELEAKIPEWLAAGKRHWTDDAGKVPGKRVLYRYLARANAKVGAYARKNVDALVSAHRAMRLALYEKALSKGEIGVAHQILRDLGRLDSVYPAKQVKLTAETRSVNVEVNLDARLALDQLAQRLGGWPDGAPALGQGAGDGRLLDGPGGDLEGVWADAGPLAAGGPDGGLGPVPAVLLPAGGQDDHDGGAGRQDDAGRVPGPGGGDQPVAGPVG